MGNATKLTYQGVRHIISWQTPQSSPIKLSTTSSDGKRHQAHLSRCPPYQTPPSSPVKVSTRSSDAKRHHVQPSKCLPYHQLRNATNLTYQGVRLVI
jgi:hypothetical protein